jgi:hypothetical protein
MLTKNHRQEVLSRAYVQAVAGKCGLSCTFRDLDYGIDATVHEIGRRGSRYFETGFKLDMQAKSTAAQDLTDTHVRYDLSVKNYDDLCDPEVGTPRILVLLVLPRDEGQWLEQTEEHLILRRAAYWLSLRGQERTANQKTIRVLIPRSNLFTPETLRLLMEKVRKEEPL